MKRLIFHFVHFIFTVFTFYVLQQSNTCPKLKPKPFIEFDSINIKSNQNQRKKSSALSAFYIRLNPSNRNQIKNTINSTPNKPKSYRIKTSIVDAARAPTPQNENAPAIWNVQARKHAYRTFALTHVLCARRVEKMHSVKPSYIGHDAHVPAAISDDQISNANRIRNVTQKQQHERPMHMTNSHTVSEIRIVGRRWPAMATDSASTHVRAKTMRAKETNGVRRVAIDRCACANLDLS